MSTPTTTRAADGRSFLGAFLRRPGSVGAIAPSSAHLAREMVRGLDLQNAGAVIEFGPGTGVFTGEILQRLGPTTKFIAIELDPHLAELCRQRHPTAEILNDSVANVESICRQRGIPHADIIISGLPWASFPESLQDELLGAMLRILRAPTVEKPGGTFVTFAYQTGTWLPAGKRFAAKITRMFGKVQRSALVWRNLPPAFVYRCQR